MTNQSTIDKLIEMRFTAMADAFLSQLLDRIVHDAYMINIESIDSKKDISMREIYGLDKSLAE